jgi:hypothetical protein
VHLGNLSLPIALAHKPKLTTMPIVIFIVFILLIAGDCDTDLASMTQEVQTPLINIVRNSASNLQ